MLDYFHDDMKVNQPKPPEESRKALIFYSVKCFFKMINYLKNIILCNKKVTFFQI